MRPWCYTAWSQPRFVPAAPGRIASALLAVVEPICIVSGFYDGGYSDPDRSALHVAYQLLFVATIAVVGVLAGLRLSSLLRRRG